MNTEQKSALRWAVEQMNSSSAQAPHPFKNQWLNAFLAAVVAAITALLSASCTTYLII